MEHLRLYLDTADILDIANGMAPAASVASLKEAMHETGAVLVISIEHAWDILPKEKAHTVERVVAAIDSFPRVVGVFPPAPHEFELTGDATDLTLRSFGATVREFFDGPGSRTAVGTLAPVATALTEGEQATLGAASATGRRNVSKKEGEMVVHVAMEIFRSGMADSETIVRCWEKYAGPVEDAAARQAIVGKLVPLAEKLKLLPLELMPEADVIRNLRALGPSAKAKQGPIGADAKTQPARFLAHRLKYEKRRNVLRHARESDIVDSFHAQYLPYVDVFGTDGGNIPILKDALLEAMCKRSARLVQNGRLDIVAVTIRDLAQSDCATSS